MGSGPTVDNLAVMDSSLLGRWGAWPFRITWLLLPVLAGPSLEDSLDHLSRSVQLATSIGLWGAWAALLLASLVPVTATLTAVRIVAPLGVVAVLAAALQDTDGEAMSAWHPIGAGWAALCIFAAFLPSTGATFVNGSSYGNERRMPLRVPGPLLLGPVQLAWLVVVAAGLTGPLLLINEMWIAGAVAIAAGAPALRWGVRALHTLARRWTVFVPGGLVLHDPLTLADPTLFRRSIIRAIGPAPTGTDATDLTADALGLAIEARFSQSLPLARVTNRKRRETETVDSAAVLFTPTQPGAFLAAAREHSLVRS